MTIKTPKNATILVYTFISPVHIFQIVCFVIEAKRNSTGLISNFKQPFVVSR